jgi:hypothetical protein
MRFEKNVLSGTLYVYLPTAHVNPRSTHATSRPSTGSRGGASAFPSRVRGRSDRRGTRPPRLDGLPTASKGSIGWAGGTRDGIPARHIGASRRCSQRRTRPPPRASDLGGHTHPDPSAGADSRPADPHRSHPPALVPSGRPYRGPIGETTQSPQGAGGRAARHLADGCKRTYQTQNS